jgi:hypothetical protein
MLVGVVTSCFMACGNASGGSDDKLSHEEGLRLDKMCSDLAQDLLKRNEYRWFDKTYDGQGNVLSLKPTYTDIGNHYNVKRKQCLVMVSWVGNRSYYNAAEDRLVASSSLVEGKRVLMLDGKPATEADIEALMRD